MKHLWVVVLLLSSVWAQEPGTNGAITLQVPVTGTFFHVYTPPQELLPDSDHNVLLIRRASEPCNECGFRNAVYCSNMSADCGMPSKEVLHYHWYHTIAAALKEAEEQNWDVVWIAVTKSMEFEKSKTEEHQKQPDVVTVKNHYKVKP